LEVSAGQGKRGIPANETSGGTAGRFDVAGTAPDGLPSGAFEELMRILVQDRRTNAFLTQDSKWVKQLDYARPFPTSLDALRYCVERDLRGMDMLVWYPGQKTNLRVPLC
jgi:hypothetical protein